MRHFRNQYVCDDGLISAFRTSSLLSSVWVSTREWQSWVTCSEEAPLLLLTVSWYVDCIRSRPNLVPPFFYAQPEIRARCRSQNQLHVRLFSELLIGESENGSQRGIIDLIQVRLRRSRLRLHVKHTNRLTVYARLRKRKTLTEKNPQTLICILACAISELSQQLFLRTL